MTVTNTVVRLFSFQLVLVQLVLFTSTVVHGFVECPSPNTYNPTYCRNDQKCCGLLNTDCCDDFDEMSQLFGSIFGLLVIIFFLVMCYRCCCRRTTSHGIVYSPAPSAGTTNIAVSLPPQQVQPSNFTQMPQPIYLPYPQQMPQPNVVPFPQQTPYPPQYAQNPYHGVPPPGYGVSQAAYQQASAPSAPPP